MTVSAGAACPENSHTVADGKCLCATNYEEKDRACVRKPITCPQGQRAELGACVVDNCKPAEKLINGICVPLPPCPEDQARINNGSCKSHGCKKWAPRTVLRKMNGFQMVEEIQRLFSAKNMLEATAW